METRNKKSRANEGSAFLVAYYVVRSKSNHQVWFQLKVRLIVTNTTKTMKKKLFLMPRVALTEETGIILARHLKS
jgi:hypothetical protein